MAGKKKFSILIVPPSSGDTIQITLPSLLVSLAGFLAVSGVLFFGFLLLQFIGSQNTTEQLEALQAEKASLESRLASVKSSMATFGACLDDIEKTEKNIRLVFGFPDVDPAERALGIGGFPWLEDSMDVSYAQLPFDSEANLAALIRRASFERQNFDQILDSLVVRKDQLDHTPSIRPTEGYFSSPFGVRRRHPVTGIRSMHRGVDFAGRIGTPVIAPADGRVVDAPFSKSLGKMLVVDHGFGIRTVYGHLHERKVKVGQRITRGEPIAAIGDTGLMTTGPHLHYEIHVNGRPINPMNFIWDYPLASSTVY